MARFVFGSLVLTLMLAGREQVRADYVSFVPPNDPTGTVYTNSHDDGPIGRGIVFQMSADTTIDAVGSLPGWTGALQIAEVTSLGVNVRTGEKILRSVSTGSTIQSPWITYSIAPLLLQKGRDYHIEFYAGTGKQSFFYNNSNIPFSIGNFTAIDGTFDGLTWNTAVPAIQVHIQDTPVSAPEPSSLITLGIGVIGLAGYRWRQRKLFFA